MSRSYRLPRSEAPSLLLILLLAPPPLFSAVHLEAGARAERQGINLVVSLELRNRGETDARPLAVTARLLGETEATRLETGVAAGAVREAELRFRGTPSGRHALVLRLSYPLAPGGTDPVEFLTVAPLVVDRDTPPPVDVSAKDLALETAGALDVKVSSGDGKPHEASLLIAMPKGLGLSPYEERVLVPAQGARDVKATIFRGQSPRGGEVSVWAILEPIDGSAVFREAKVNIEGDPALLPRFRVGLLILAVLLLLGAFVIELGAQFRPRGAEGSQRPL